MQNVLTCRHSALREALFPAIKIENEIWIIAQFSASEILPLSGGETMTHLVFPDTFNLSHVSRSASVMLESLMKLGASWWGVCLPRILLWARSSFWRSGALLEFVSTGSVSWVLKTQATTVFPSSGWSWSLLIWLGPPHHRKSQVEGGGADKQNVKHGNLEAEGRMQPQEHPFPPQKHGINRAVSIFIGWDLGSCTCQASALTLGYISSSLCYPFNTIIKQMFFLPSVIVSSLSRKESQGWLKTDDDSYEISAWQ